METSSLPTVHIDFHNADSEGFVRLNTVGAIEDLSRLKMQLEDGLPLCATDGEISVNGIVRAAGSEGVWRLQVDWAEIFRKHAQLK